MTRPSADKFKAYRFYFLPYLLYGEKSFSGRMLFCTFNCLRAKIFKHISAEQRKIYIYKYLPNNQ